VTKTKVFLVVAAAAFVSCSSDGNTTVPAQGSSADLGECNSYNEGVTKQVSADGLYYKCTAGSWQETEREANNPGPLTGNTLYDSRDGHTYRTVTFGDQTLMAENLNFEMENSSCYGNDPANCIIYGRLYGWDAAMTACPSGWHLPNYNEWETLFTAVGGGIYGRSGSQVADGVV